jgi:hypothetical protein
VRLGHMPPVFERGLKTLWVSGRLLDLSPGFFCVPRHARNRALARGLLQTQAFKKRSFRDCKVVPGASETPNVVVRPQEPADEGRW